MIDHGDELLRLKVLPNCIAQATFNAFYSLQVWLINAFSFVIVNRISNLAAELMKQKLHEIVA